MSCTADHATKEVRQACQSCRARKARFRFRGRVKSDRDHTLCFECYRSERDRRRARLLAGMMRPLVPIPSDRTREGGGGPTSAWVEHRRRMLAHLGARKR